MLLHSAPFVTGQAVLQQTPEVRELLNKPITDEEFRVELDAAQSAAVDDLIAKLGAPVFQDREQATAGLIDAGAGAFAKLRSGYHSADDLETKLRIENIVRTAYLNFHVLDRYGFLGISMNVFDPTTPALLGQVRAPRGQQKNLAPPRLPEGRVGVYVAQVIEGTGAARAGLQEGDVLIALNGLAVEGKGEQIRQSFSAAIRDHRPGETIELMVVRGDTLLSILATLSRPPESVARQNNIIAVSELYRQVSERFQTWWELYFRNPAGLSASQPAPYDQP